MHNEKIAQELVKMATELTANKEGDERVALDNAFNSLYNAFYAARDDYFSSVVHGINNKIRILKDVAEMSDTYRAKQVLKLIPALQRLETQVERTWGKMQRIIMKM